MSKYKVECACGWEIETNDLSTALAANVTHDETCPHNDKDDSTEAGESP